MDTLTKDTLQLIQDTAVLASGATGKLVIMHPEQEPDHVYLTVDGHGLTERIEAQPLPREHTVCTLDEALIFAAKHGTDKSVVWFERDGVVVVLDDSTRRDQAGTPFRFSSQFAALTALDAAKDRKFAQKEFRRFLRVTMDGATNDLRLLNFVSSVRWNATSNSAGVVTHQKVSLGRDIEESVTGGDGSECPEEITFNVRVFDDPGLLDTQTVRCAVELIVAEQAFVLLPFPMQTSRAIDLELGAIGARIREAVKCPVYRGKP